MATEELVARLGRLRATQAEQYDTYDLCVRGDDPSGGSELQELASRIPAGAVQVATLQASGDPTGPRPCEGDLVVLRWAILPGGSNADPSAGFGDGASVPPVSFCLLGKSPRVPPCVELALSSMTPGQRCAIRSDPAYAIKAPSCSVAPPRSLAASSDDVTTILVELLAVVPGDAVSSFELGEPERPEDCAGWMQPWMGVRKVLRAGGKFERALEGYKADVSWRCRAVDGDDATAAVLATLGDEAESSELAMEGGHVVVQIGGDGGAPAAVAGLLQSIVAGDVAFALVPAAALPAGDGGPFAVSEAVRSGSAFVAATCGLHAVKQVRDVFGDGSIVKEKLREGEGDFPMDAPVEDCPARIRYRVIQGDFTGEWEECEVNLGDGDVPEGVEFAAKLMCPREVARSTCRADRAYAQAQHLTPPEGVDASKGVIFEIELLSFERPPNITDLDSMKEQLGLANAAKESANRCFRRGLLRQARQKYNRVLTMLKHTGLSDPLMVSEEPDGSDDAVAVQAGLQLAVTLRLNLAATALALREYREAAVWCGQALEGVDRGGGGDAARCKALLRRGKAHTGLAEYGDAARDLQEARVLAEAGGDGVPPVEEVERALRDLAEAQRKGAQRAKRDFGGMFDKARPGAA
ncbi:unnamed protein product [Pedinophyceae sp. YPF-701]|nr:unnamed protein product [Pedinophyceae sp. YPF-701]